MGQVEPSNVCFSIPSALKPKQRTRGANRYLPEQTKNDQNMIAWYARRHATELAVKKMRPLTEGRLYVWIEMVTKALRGDIDNIAKTAFDGLQDGGLIKNDVQIDELRFTRSKGKIEKTTITVGHIAVGGTGLAAV